MPIAKDPLAPADLPSIVYSLTGDVTGSATYEQGDTTVTIATTLSGDVGSRLTTVEGNVTSLFTAWIPNYANAAAVQSATIGATNHFIRIGHADDSRMSLFQRVTGVQTLARVQSADGQYWEPAGDVITTHHGRVIAEASALSDVVGMGRAAYAAYKLDIPYRVEHDEEIAMSFTMDTEAFNEDGDEAEYNSRVAAAYRTTTDDTFYETEWTAGASEGYKAHMARAHGLFKVADWFSKCPRTGIGTFYVQPDNGAHYVFGVKKLEGFNGYFRIKGKNLTQGITVNQITFAAHPTLGSSYSTATIRFDGSVQSAGMTVVPDMCAVVRQSKSTAADGTDGARLVNGALCIESITTDVTADDTITATIYNPFASVPVSPAAIDTGDGAIDDPYGTSIIYGCQFLITGGFNDRSDESFFSGVDGSDIFEEQIAWVDATDQRTPIYSLTDTITTPGVDPERKGRFTGLQSKYRAQSVAICGFDGRVVRISKGASVALNLCAIGGIGKFQESIHGAAERGASAQLASHIEGIRCVVGNVRSFGISGSTGSHVVWENCAITGALIGGRGLTNAMIDVSATEIAYCPTGAYMNGHSTLIVNGQTKFISCTIGVDLQGEADIAGTVLPVFSNCGTNISGRRPGKLKTGSLGVDANNIDITWDMDDAAGWQDLTVDVRNIIADTGLNVLELQVQIAGAWETAASYSWRYTDFATDNASSIATRMSAGGTPETESELISGVGAVSGDLSSVRLTIRDFDRGSNPIVIEHEAYAVDTGTRARYTRGISYVEGSTGAVTGVRLQIKGGTNNIEAGASYKVMGQ